MGTRRVEIRALLASCAKLAVVGVEAGVSPGCLVSRGASLNKQIAAVLPVLQWFLSVWIEIILLDDEVPPVSTILAPVAEHVTDGERFIRIGSRHQKSSTQAVDASYLFG